MKHGQPYWDNRRKCYVTPKYEREKTKTDKIFEVKFIVFDERKKGSLSFEQHQNITVAKRLMEDKQPFTVSEKTSLLDTLKSNYHYTLCQQEKLNLVRKSMEENQESLINQITELQVRNNRTIKLLEIFSGL